MPAESEEIAQMRLDYSTDQRVWGLLDEVERLRAELRTTVTEQPEEIGQVRERIARALYEAGAWCGSCSSEGWDSCAECRRTLLGYAVAVLDVLGLERVRWMVWEDPQDPDSRIAVGLDSEDLTHYPHRTPFTAIPPSLSDSKAEEDDSDG